ncbi:pleckstrin homology domain-containing family G member 1 [Conger conger]|uniref:pleckstrin homology domain-containing family G member 1 n=1 Tax=Conger conger TaxID=82655 RepID=UPI002A5A2976|nr:pleckstrin homology domain-containing family G member 1 [Conger conger]
MNRLQTASQAHILGNAFDVAKSDHVTSSVTFYCRVRANGGLESLSGTERRKSGGSPRRPGVQWERGVPEFQLGMRRALEPRLLVGSRCSLACPAPPGPAPDPDASAGAIQLELVPARQLHDDEGRGPARQLHDDEGRGPARQLHDDEGRGPAQATPAAPPPATPPAAPTPARAQAPDYLDCISNQSRLALGVEDRGSLFGNIRDIYHFNSELLQDLERCNADPVAIAECFVAKSEEFHIYTQYCTNYPRSVAVLTECMRNKALAKFFRERQESLQHSLPLGSYLLKPVQRILKYHLLLHEIANHLEKGTETYDVVLEAIDTMQRVAWQINDMKRKHEHAVRLQEIQSQLTNWKGPDLISYGELVLEGTFRIQRAKNERTLFLFDRLLLVTKKREETFTYKAHILCCNLMLVELIPKEPLSFSVFHYKNPKLQHTVQAKSQQDKRMWILHLKRLILENHPAKIPAKAKQAILEMDAVHHPGFHYSPDGEKKFPPHAKEGPATRRVRRKSEPLSKLLKNSKQSANSDAQKRSSLGVTLLSPVSALNPREGMLASIGRTRSLVNQSQESLDPGDPSDTEDSAHLQDADDEDDTCPGSGKKFKIQARAARKRLNPQVSVDSIDKWQNFNMSACDLQTAKESLQMDAGHTPLGGVSRPSDPHHADPRLASVLGAASLVRNIWTDHQIRRAMFPPRQQTLQGEDEDDIYQMFLPSDPPVPEQARDRAPQARPCSWHMEQPAEEEEEEEEVAAPAGRRMLRRASSVGENRSESHAPLEGALTETSSNVSGSDSAERLTPDEVEIVYDNISYEDLKAMGLIRRVESENSRARAGEDARTPPQNKESGSSSEPVERPPSNEEGLSETAVPSENRASITSSTASTCSAAEAPAPVKCELEIVEENIYDTIGLLDLRLPEVLVSGVESEDQRQDVPAVPEPVYANCEVVVSSVSEETLRDVGGEVRDPESSSTSDSLPREQAGPSSTQNRMTERVDEIWNDLENYIRKNERKQEARLLAAFPVGGTEGGATSTSTPAQPRIPTLNIPALLREETMEEDEESRPTPSVPRPLPHPPSPVVAETVTGTVRAAKSKLHRLSGGSFRFDDGDDADFQKEEEEEGGSGTLLGLSGSMFPGDLASLDHTVASTGARFHLPGSAGELPLDWGDKTRNRVFLMARQYSQKIKKANQLLKLRNPEQEQAGGRSRPRQKDLAAILEEKKQGGAAIGARIAEYSHLYEQVVFREMPAGGHKPPRSNSVDPESLQRSSQSDSEGRGAEEDWLHSTYSNGELADFVCWPRDASTPRPKLTPACSVPALKTLPSQPLPLLPPNQRWSACLNQPITESLDQEHIYSSLGRRSGTGTSPSKAPPHGRCQSISSIVAAVGKAGGDPSGKENSQAASNRGSGGGAKTPRFPVPSLGQAGRQHSLPEKSSSSLFLSSSPPSNGSSEMTLRDGRQVVVVSRSPPLTPQAATQNYLANFKDNGDGDDDDDEDYVEIKSEDEEQDPPPKADPAPTSRPCSDRQSGRGLIQSQSLPCTPVKSCHHPAINPAVPLHAFADQGKLSDYLWSEPQGSPKIVQSLRDKFHCLSSSSFA